MQPLVSIVVPVFNGMPHLTSLVDSVTQQTYPNLEIIFSEGGGSDGSFDFLNTIDDPRVRITRMPVGTSAAGNWTAVSGEARGEFTKLVCQDDVIYPEAITHQVADLLATPSAAMSIAQRDIIDARGSVLFQQRGLAGLPKGSSTVSGDELLRACYLQGTNVLGEPLAVLFRTEALQNAMPWEDQDPLMLDLSTYQKVALNSEVAVRRESIGAFRVSNASWSTRIARDQLEQTKRWQDNYANTARTRPSRADRARAAVGRHASTNLRRLAYATLRLKGTFNSEAST